MQLNEIYKITFFVSIPYYDIRCYYWAKMFVWMSFWLVDTKLYILMDCYSIYIYIKLMVDDFPVPDHIPLLKSSR